MTAETERTFYFGDICVDPRTGLVLKAGSPVPLEPKGFRLLTFLVENRGRLVEKTEILDAIWPGTMVTEYALTGAIAKLRKAIGDDTKNPKYIQTVHTRGYRFIAPVEIRRDPDSKTERLIVVAGRTPPTELPAAVGGTAANATGAGFWRLPWSHSLALVGALAVLICTTWLLWNTSHRNSQTAPGHELRSEALLQQARRYTDNPDAYEAFLKGHYFMNKATKEGLAKSVEYFRQAIELES